MKKENVNNENSELTIKVVYLSIMMKKNI